MNSYASDLGDISDVVPFSNSETDPNNLGFDIDAFKVGSVNINSILCQSRLSQIETIIKKNNFACFAIQETKLTDKVKTPPTPGYNFVRKDRGRNKGGGLAFLIHETVNFNIKTAILPNDPHIEELTVIIPGQTNSITIRNVYIPPTTSCTQNYNPPVNKIFQDLDQCSMVLGDFNAHHELWFSPTNDLRGESIADALTNLDFGPANEDLPTRVAAGSSTSPDISFL